MGTHVLLNLLNKLGKREKCEVCRVFNRFFATSLTNSIIQEHELLSRHMRFPTMWYVRPVKPQISLRICAV